MSLLKKLSANPKPTETKQINDDNWDIEDDEFDAIVKGSPPKIVKTEDPKIDVIVGTFAQFDEDHKETVLRLFRLPPDTEFTFRAPKGKGMVYMNNMRQVLSRARKIAGKDKRPIVRWKVLVVGFKEEPTQDLVTVIRTQSASLRQQSVYDELLDAMNATGEYEDE